MEKVAMNEPQGIGGWLILPALGLMITPFRLGYYFYRDQMPVLTPEIWNALTNSGSEAYHPLWGAFIAFEVLANLTYFFFTLWLLWHFFRRSNKTPILFVVWFSGAVAMMGVDIMLARMIPAAAAALDGDTIKEFVRSIFAAAIWIPYFMKSKRVKNTFIEPVSRPFAAGLSKPGPGA